MRVMMGFRRKPAASEVRQVLEVWDTEKVINPHILFLGISGSGKSYRIKSSIFYALVIAFAENKKNPEIPIPRFHIMDVAGDLGVPGEDAFDYTTAAKEGINAFNFISDKKIGGVDECANSFIKLLDAAERSKLGHIQTLVLKRLIVDTFLRKGFHPTRPETWEFGKDKKMILPDMSFGKDRVYIDIEKSDIPALKALRIGAFYDGNNRGKWSVPVDNYKGEVTKWPIAMHEKRVPTFDDLLSYAKQIQSEQLMGQTYRVRTSAEKIVRHLSKINSLKVERVQASMQSGQRVGSNSGMIMANIDRELVEMKREAIAAYGEFLNQLVTGDEIKMFDHYPPDALKSVILRLEVLAGRRIFKAEEPIFSNDKFIHRHNFSAYVREDKIIAILSKLKQIYYSRARLGELGISRYVTDVIVLDELGTYASKDKNDDGHIINIIIREARKYGITLWGAHQEYEPVPDSILKGVATKIILRLGDLEFAGGAKKLKIEENLLRAIVPKVNGAVHMVTSGASEPWQLLEFPVLEIKEDNFRNLIVGVQNSIELFSVPSESTDRGRNESLSAFIKRHGGVGDSSANSILNTAFYLLYLKYEF